MVSILFDYYFLLMIITFLIIITFLMIMIDYKCFNSIY